METVFIDLARCQQVAASAANMHHHTASICIILHLLLGIFGSDLAGNVNTTAAVHTPNVANAGTELDVKTLKSDSQSVLASRLDELLRLFQAANETNLLESIFVRLEKLQAALDADGRKKDCTERQDSEVRHDSSGSTYIRWGRTTCEGDARVVYRGYAAGPHHASQGSGANFLCLHEMPKFGKYQYGKQIGMGHIYGVSYDLVAGRNSFQFSTVNTDGQPLETKPGPCVLCHIPKRSTNVMIPATNVCPSGWTMEYQGYVVSETHNGGRQRSNYVCWDESPETVPGGTSEYQTVVYPVEIGCGSLPCSTFIDGLELTCVVCSK